MKISGLWQLVFGALLLATPVWAQPAPVTQPATKGSATLKAVPAPQNVKLPNLPLFNELKADGAKIYSLGEVNGLTGWVALKDGRSQIFYTTKDDKNIVLGVLYAADGKSETLDQLNKLKEQGIDIEKDMLQQTQASASKGENASMGSADLPEKLWKGLTETSYFTLGKVGAPLLYLIVDPTCSYCKSFWKELNEPYVKNNEIELRVVPTGVLSADGEHLATLILGAKNPLDLWKAAADNDVTAFAGLTESDEAKKKHERNLTFAKNWQIKGVPYAVYKDRSGKVQVMYGRPKDVGALVQSLYHGS